LQQDSGVLNGNLVGHNRKCIGKNIGKSNETSSVEQAVLEAKAIIKDKLTKGYFETIEEAAAEEVILPMLAHDYFKHVNKVDWKENWYVQPKFDGMRCLAFVTANGDVTLMSRAGKEITTMTHICNELSKIKLDIILDGELYVHGENFQENMKYIKKYKKGLSEKIQFNVYDCVEKGTFQDRNLKIFEILRSGLKFKHVTEVRTHDCLDLDCLIMFHQNFLENGYEGTMLRKRDSLYKVNGRSHDLLKYKDFKDLALPILDITPDEADPTMGSPVYAWPGASGHKLGENIIGSGIRANHVKRREMLSNKQDYIGKTYELRFFEYSDKGVPRFPITIGERLDK
jgi:ATP-dependent DNA ligase